MVVVESWELHLSSPEIIEERYLELTDENYWAKREPDMDAAIEVTIELTPRLLGLAETLIESGEYETLGELVSVLLQEEGRKRSVHWDRPMFSVASLIEGVTVDRPAEGS